MSGKAVSQSQPAKKATKKPAVRVSAREIVDAAADKQAAIIRSKGIHGLIGKAAANIAILKSPKLVAAVRHRERQLASSKKKDQWKAAQPNEARLNVRRNLAPALKAGKITVDVVEAEADAAAAAAAAALGKAKKSKKQQPKSRTRTGPKAAAKAKASRHGA